MRFFIRIFINPYPHLPDSHILDKNFPKKNFCEGVLLYFEISLLSFIHKIFEQNFYLYTTVYLVRIWTYKNADEKAHTFLSRSKDVKKRMKRNEKRILCKFTFRSRWKIKLSNPFSPYFAYRSISKLFKTFAFLG